MNHGRLMAESCLDNISNNALNSGLKQPKQFPLPVLSEEENLFFREAPPHQSPGTEGVQPVTGVPISEARPIVLQGHSGDGAEHQHPSPRQPLKTSEESSRWYRYVTTNFFNTPGFKTTFRGQKSSFLSELEEHYKRPLGSGNCGGVQNRVSGTSSPDLHSQRAYHQWRR